MELRRYTYVFVTRDSYTIKINKIKTLEEISKKKLNIGYMYLLIPSSIPLNCYIVSLVKKTYVYPMLHLVAVMQYFTSANNKRTPLPERK